MQKEAKSTPVNDVEPFAVPMDRSEQSEASIMPHCYCGSLIIDDDKLAALFVI